MELRLRVWWLFGIVHSIGSRLPEVLMRLMLCGVFVACAFFPAAAQWIDTLPAEYADELWWSGDVEEGSLYDWAYPDFQYPGGGIENTGGPGEAESVGSTDVAHSGSHSARATIRNAFQAQNGSKAVRLFRRTDRPWDDGGQFFPSSAYYAAWYYFPHTYNPNKYPPFNQNNSGWWNLFQFKSEPAPTPEEPNPQSEPLFTLNLAHDDGTGTMEFYLYTKYNTPASWGQATPAPIPVGQWVHVEALYQQSNQGRGRIAMWQDGRLILNVPRMNTILYDEARWGIGNYTDHIVGGPIDGEATIYFDDATVGTRRVSGSFAAPVSAVPDGHHLPGQAMRASRGAADQVDLDWDATTCSEPAFHLLWGTGADLSGYRFSGAACSLSPTGVDQVPIADPNPGELLWWVIVAADGATEGHHGFSSDGLVRPSQSPGFCGLTAQGETTSCWPARILSAY